MFRFFEDPTHPSMGPHLKLLAFTGLWQSNKAKSTKFKELLILLTLCFFVSQYLKCLIKVDRDSLKLILQFSPYHLGVVKTCFLRKDYQAWKNLINYVSTLENRQTHNGQNSVKKIIKLYIGENRHITYFVWLLGVLSISFTLVLTPAAQLLSDQIGNGTNVNLIIFDAYTPFSDQPPGQYVSMFLQTIFGCTMAAYITGWDTMVISLIIFFAGQMKVARLFCANLIDETNPEKSHKNIADFHSYYMELLRYQKLFNALISPVMFIYLTVVSLSLGVCIIEIVQLEGNLSQKLSSYLLIGCSLFQLFYFYWHCNEVTFQSNLVNYAVFESAWPAANIQLIRKILLMGFATQKVMVFKAGPFNQINLSTFIGIVRASYSFYTVLDQTN